MGNTETFKMTFMGPNISSDVITNNIEAGDFSNLTKDDILGDLLFIDALTYYVELDAMDFIISKTMGIVAIRLPSENILSHELKVQSFFGIPFSVSSGSISMDVDRAMTLVKTLDGNNDKSLEFFLSTGGRGSALEHSVLEQLFSTPDNPVQGISAVKALQIANDQGIPIYTINQTNINTILPQLQVGSDVKIDIINAVNSGKEVTVSKTDIIFNNWTGCGYIIIDPATGTGAYMISGGLSGSLTMQEIIDYWKIYLHCLTGKISAHFHSVIIKGIYFFGFSLVGIASKKLLPKIFGVVGYVVTVSGVMIFIMQMGEKCIYEQL